MTRARRPPTWRLSIRSASRCRARACRAPGAVDATRCRLARRARDAARLGRDDGPRRRRAGDLRAFRVRLVDDVLRRVLGPLAEDTLPTRRAAAGGRVARLRGRLAEWIRATTGRSCRPARLGRGAGRALERAVAWLPTSLARIRRRGPGAASTPPPDPTRSHASFPDWPRSSIRRRPPPAATATRCRRGLVPAAGFDLSLTSVARYVFDLADWERSAWIVPLGASGHPGSAHYADQSAAGRGAPPADAIRLGARLGRGGDRQRLEPSADR